MGGLRLDSSAAALKGGKSGPVINPGNPAESILYQAVAHTHATLKMPPGGKLADSDVSDIKTWIAAGAHFDSSGPAPDPMNQRDFWVFQQPRKSTPPAVRDEAWVRAPIDRFILAKLEEKQLTPAPAAGWRTLLRRVTLDLTGLPPTPADYAAFSADHSPQAYANLVDRLLDSKAYGERWARHWLDVARYADADVLGLSAEPFPNAWRYRDWVIDSLNADMPYDQFVKAQIAGDLLDKPGEHKLTPGLGYLALGPWYYKIVEPPKARADELQDRIDVVSRGLLGLTVACARCHNHKYDPIPNRDYYALGGVLTSTEYKEKPLAPAAEVQTYKAAEQRIADLEKSIADLLAARRKNAAEEFSTHSGEYMLAVWRAHHSTDPAPSTLDPLILERWKKYLGAKRDHPLLDFWPDLAAKGTLEDAETAARNLQQTISKLVAQQKEIEAYNERVIEESKKSTDPYDIFCKGCRAETHALPRDLYIFHGDLFAGKRKTDGEDRGAGVLYLSDKEVRAYLDPAGKAHLEDLEAQLKSAKAALPKKYPFLHILADAKQTQDMPLHRRGDPYNLGEIIPRQFLSVLGKPEPAPMQHGSGRLDLANAIASPDNPLTARVIVNRVWHHHMGAGIVRTLSNFGKAGDRPSHPELLDYLTVTFIENGWSLKKLHREIVLSNAYAMSSVRSADAAAKDPDNRLLSRFNRRRLDVEALRDSMLFVAGRLDRTAGGPAADWDKDFRRRTIYGEVNRFRLERLLTLFDFPDPTIHAEKRVATNTPVQRLFFLNSAFIKDQSRTLAESAASVDALYQAILGRAPEPREKAAAADFLSSQPGQAGLAELAQVLLSSNEFCFVD
jgi:hypothetical protein